MSKWSHVDGTIKCNNLEGLEKIISEQKHYEKPWKYYENPYCSLKGSEGDVCFRRNGNELLISGDLRDVDSISEDRESIIEDFMKIIDTVEGQGYIEIEYESEGTIVVDYYGEYDCRVFPKADGWNKYYKNVKK